MKKINYAKLALTVQIVSALAHNRRLLILKCIDENGNNPVNSIYRSLDLEQSITSAHLSILSKAGIVSFEKRGKESIYSIHYHVLERFNKQSWQDFFAEKNR